MKIILLLLLLISCNSSRKPSSNESDILFTSVVVTGASISANWQGVESPGLKIARIYNSKVLVVARAGKKSTEILKEIKKIKESDFSILFGIDLFFWDSVSTNCHAGKKQIKSFLKNFKEQLSKKNVLGNIPPLVNGMFCREKLNKYMKKVCTKMENCELFDFVTLVSKLKIKDIKKYFQPDGIHLTDAGSSFTANHLLEFLGIEDHPEIY